MEIYLYRWIGKEDDYDILFYNHDRTVKFLKKFVWLSSTIKQVNC